MKIFIILIVLSMFTINSHASKARIASLLGANHLIDTQTVFTAPSHILLLDQYATFEMGAAGGGAEGGISRNTKSGNKLLIYVGHVNTTASPMPTFVGDLRTAMGYLPSNNPVEIIYGKGKSAYGLSISSVDNKKSVTKETTVIGKWGMNTKTGWVYAHAHLISSAEKAGTGGNDKLTAGPYLKLGGSHKLSDTRRIFGEIDFSQGKLKPNGGTESNVKDTNISFGIEETCLKTDKVHMYYGAKVASIKRDFDGKTEKSATMMPAFFGLEHQTTSWMQSRVSVQQNILIGSTKDTTTTATADADGIAPNTTVAAGLGFKYDDLTLDGVLTSAANGLINGNAFLAAASVTFNF